MRTRPRLTAVSPGTVDSFSTQPAEFRAGQFFSVVSELPATPGLTPDPATAPPPCHNLPLASRRGLLYNRLPPSEIFRGGPFPPAAGFNLSSEPTRFHTLRSDCAPGEETLDGQR